MRCLIPVGIFLAGFAGGAAESQAPAQTISIQLSSFKYLPATLTLARGRPYVLHFVNTASGGHDYVAKEFFASATVAPEDRRKIVNGGIALGGGESADIHVVADKPGTYKSHCSHFMHSSFGMTGSVIVQ